MDSGLGDGQGKIYRWMDYYFMKKAPAIAAEVTDGRTPPPSNASPDTVLKQILLLYYELQTVEVAVTAALRTAALPKLFATEEQAAANDFLQGIRASGERIVHS